MKAAGQVKIAPQDKASIRQNFSSMHRSYCLVRGEPQLVKQCSSEFWSKLFGMWQKVQKNKQWRSRFSKVFGTGGDVRSHCRKRAKRKAKALSWTPRAMHNEYLRCTTGFLKGQKKDLTLFSVPTNTGGKRVVSMFDFYLYMITCAGGMIDPFGGYTPACINYSGPILSETRVRAIVERIRRAKRLPRPLDIYNPRVNLELYVKYPKRGRRKRIPIYLADFPIRNKRGAFLNVRMHIDAVNGRLIRFRIIRPLRPRGLVPPRRPRA